MALVTREVIYKYQSYEFK